MVWVLHVLHVYFAGRNIRFDFLYYYDIFKTEWIVFSIINTRHIRRVVFRNVDALILKKPSRSERDFDFNLIGAERIGAEDCAVTEAPINSICRSTKMIIVFDFFLFEA